MKRIGIIGSGPAGLYLAERIIRRSPDSYINFFESRFAPFGLLRYGVAPDHPEIKKATLKLEQIFENPRVKYYGGVQIGSCIPLSMLEDFHDLIVLCTGLYGARNILASNNDAKNIIPSTTFIGCYNSDPLISGKSVDLSKVRTVAIIGGGNVALDCARILLKPPFTLTGTDINHNFHSMLSKSQVDRVNIFVRKDPLNTSFSAKELSEVLKINCKKIVEVRAIEEARARLASSASSGSSEKRKLRTLDLFQKMFDQVSDSSKSISFNFDHVPVEFDIANKGCVRGITFDVYGQCKYIEADLVIVCVGFDKGTYYPDFETADSGQFKNFNGYLPDLGRVCKYYTAGWCATGAKGALESTRQNSLMVAERIAEDLIKLPTRISVNNLLKDSLSSFNVKHISWLEWKYLDAFEKASGKRLGHSRSKINCNKDARLIIDYI